MYQKRREEQSRVKRAKSVLAALLCFIVVLSGLVPLAPTASHAQRFQTLTKACTGCGASVSINSRVGQQCPHCDAYWSFEQQKIVGSTASPAGSTETSSSTPARAPDSAAADLSGGQLFGAGSGRLSVAELAKLVPSPGRNYFVRSRGGLVEVYDAKGYYRYSLPHSKEVRSDMMSSDCRWIAVVDAGGGGSLYDLATGARRYSLAQSGCRAVLFVPGDTVMIVRRHVIYWRDAENNRLVNGRIVISRRDSFAELVWHGNSQQLQMFVRTTAGRTRVYEIGNGRTMLASH